MTSGIAAPTKRKTLSMPNPSNSGPGKAASSHWAVMNSRPAKPSGCHGRAAARSMGWTARNTAMAVTAATEPSTSSSHCMPVPSGALNGTVSASPMSASGRVQRTLRGRWRSRFTTAPPG